VITMEELTTSRTVAIYGGGGLVLIGTVGIGLLEMLLGAPHPGSGEGQIAHEALIPLSVRSSIILLGLLIWAAYGVYRVAAAPPPAEYEDAV